MAATITLTDAKGNATDYELDTETGTALAEDVTPGDYTLAVQPIEGYTQPEAQTVTVKEKVVYKADVKAVKREDRPGKPGQRECRGLRRQQRGLGPHRQRGHRHRDLRRQR